MEISCALIHRRSNRANSILEYNLHATNVRVHRLQKHARTKYEAAPAKRSSSAEYRPQVSTVSRLLIRFGYSFDLAETATDSLPLFELSMPMRSRIRCGSTALQTHPRTMSAPPATSFAPTASPRRAAAKAAAQMGSVASSTDASEDAILPRARVSPSRLAAVVMSPVHAAAAAT